MEIPDLKELGLEWKLHPGTQHLLKLFRDSVATAKDQWLEGAYLSSDTGVQLMLDAAGRSSAETLQRIILAIENIKAESDDGK